MTKGASGGVLCVGRVYCDLVFSGVPRLPSLGTEVFADSLALHAGGGAYISAAYFAALGRPTYLAATLAVDPFGATLRQHARNARIDVTLCTDAAPEDDPQITAVIVGARDRAFLTRASGVAARVPTLADLQARNITHLHIGELGTAQELPHLLDVAHRGGLSVSLDCGWQDAPDQAAATLIRKTDVFLPNEDELAHLTNTGIAIEGPVCVVKQGARGAYLRGGPSCPGQSVKVVDTTGAGDAFNAGFVHNWLDKADPMDCLRLGNACGAAAVQFAGGCGGTGRVRASEVLAAQ